MTAMSVIRRDLAHIAAPKQPRSRHALPLARTLHELIAMLAPRACLGLGILLMTGCVFPPSLSLDQPDAQPDSPPAILSVRGADGNELAPDSTVVFARGSGQLNLTLRDTDIDDSLNVGIYVNYNHPDPTPARSTCTAASGQSDRITACDLSGLCQTADVGAGLEEMTIVVFDRALLDSGTPLYQAMPPGGLSTQVFFNLTCTNPTT
jgi:hypothetical protein